MRLFDLLLLADGRTPLGSYAHSFGLESATAAGDVYDVASLAAFIEGRLLTSGEIEAAFASATTARLAGCDPDTMMGVVAAVDAELAARVAPAPLRSASRELGRHLLRTAATAWPTPEIDRLRDGWPGGLQQPVALGAVGARLELPCEQVAVLAAHGLASAIASAGVRLLGLDPMAVTAVLATLGSFVAEVGRDAAAHASRPLAELPSWAAPLVDIRAESHTGAGGGHLFAT